VERGSVVAIGGGHGLARALSALRLLGEKPTAVVTVADDGGSSGRLRRDLGIIALGDLRQALVALARNRDLAALFAHRFRRGELDGHAVGNLALLALAEQAGGDFVAALDAAARILDCEGRALPATTTPVSLRAHVDGRPVEGQVRVARSGGRIDRVWLDPEDAGACGEAVDVLGRSSTVVLGPGSLYTSVIATLAVPGLARALAGSGARVVYVANMTAQRGETSGLSAREHVEALVEHVRGLVLDTVILHDGPVHPASEPIHPTLEHPAVRRVIRADLAARTADGGIGWGHDPRRLAEVLERVLQPGQ
jgi:uncharacterized cofD-like protein